MGLQAGAGRGIMGGMNETLVLGVAAVAVAVLVMQVLLLVRRRPGEEEARLRGEFDRSREQAAAEARGLRDELAGRMDALGRASAEVAAQQRQELAAGQAQFSNVTQERLEGVRRSVTESLALQRQEQSAGQAKLSETVQAQLEKVRADNAARLEEMRKTVDEKLNDTLEKRLGERFEIVTRHLENVAKGLGEMQQLATGVGDLKNLLTNVKSRGTWGEYQLGAILEEIFTPDQYAANVKVNPKSAEVVEFAIRLPGRGGAGDPPVWLPIDAKFPKEDYERMQAAAEASDKDALEAAQKALERRIRDSAKDICDKYIVPPHTTNFGILFLPTEGLYAEVLRRPGLVDDLQRVYRVNVAGPTTLMAMLNSLQMGFRTLAIEKRSSEVWQVLAAVKTEFGKFGEVFEKLQKKIDEADSVLKSVGTRRRAMERTLKTVESLTETETEKLLPAAAEEDS